MTDNVVPIDPDREIEEVWSQRHVDVKALLEHHGMSVQDFAITYALPIKMIRAFVEGREEPQVEVRSYLWVIAHAPDTVRDALKATKPTISEVIELDPCRLALTTDDVAEAYRDTIRGLNTQGGKEDG